MADNKNSRQDIQVIFEVCESHKKQFLLAIKYIITVFSNCFRKYMKDKCHFFHK